MILEYCHEGTFDYENVQFDDNYYKFVLELYKICRDNYVNNCTPLIVRKIENQSYFLLILVKIELIVNVIKMYIGLSLRKYE